MPLSSPSGPAVPPIGVMPASRYAPAQSRPGRRAILTETPPEARAEAQDRRRLLHDLRQAAAAGAFALHYQRRIRLANGAITGAEALIRWPHRKRGMMPPDRFIPLAEQHGLIGDIGAWVLETGCAEAARWRAPGHPTLGVNVSARQLREPGFSSRIALALERSGLPAERLDIELTESMLLDVDDDILFTLSALRDMGVGLSLDDFGTGYASLAMLRRVPLTTLKIDRMLVRDLPRNTEDLAIVRAMVQTCHAMGLTVVAEGVETEAQRECLAAIGADEGQGYLFGRPGPADQLFLPLAA
ncbi:MAG: EAL domain-containing protein [Proteobacteria bacterium]|nr:EAL domain-containing protein [Pseudomonadota bacterium]